MVRVAAGVGYWLQPGVAARQLGAGDGLMTTGNGNGVLRASQLGELKLQFFFIHPQYLNGLLTVPEWHRLEVTPKDGAFPASIFTADQPLAQRFTRLAEQSRREGLPVRCGLLQLWANAVADLLPVPAVESAGGGKLRERFQQLVGRMPEAELSRCSLHDLAGQLNCSERHFTRLFRKEFGVPFRARQIELRLQHASQLLADPDTKIINVAYDSGYQHLGLFNMMFKKRFGMTPSKWRQQSARRNPPAPFEGGLSKAARASLLLVLFILNLVPTVFAHTSSATPAANDSQSAPADPEAITQARAALFQKLDELDTREKDTRVHVVSTNAGPRFAVSKYLVTGNSILTPETIGWAITNVDGAFGTNTSFEGIHAVMAELLGAYRERGYVTVSVALPRQKLTNETVQVQVTEGRLAAINVTGNHHYSSNDVMRALPSLHTNMLLNSHVLQGELDAANASRDRQIYPVVGPGPDPGTSELTLKVKDRLPLHSRLELNNQGTPGTPNLRTSFNAQYDNLWDLEHQVGLQYGFSPEQMKDEKDYLSSPLDDPLIANYSGYYRMPLGGYNSVQEQIESNPGSFGYNEVTHKFNLPPATGRPEMNVYASRSVSGTGAQYDTRQNVISTSLITIDSQDSSDNVTLNEGLGGRLSLPLPVLATVSSVLSFGVDYKRYQKVGYNTNNFYVTETSTNSSGDPVSIETTVSSPGTTSHTTLVYLPFNVGWNGSVPDSLGTTFLNAQANFNVAGLLSDNADFSATAYSTNARAGYVTLQMGASRVQTLYQNWSVKLRADGQWANGPLISNEQYAMGGSSSVRGYQDGQAYGDTGWRCSIEPQTPLVNIGRIGNQGHEEPCWLRGSVFLDYGQISDLATGYSGAEKFCGTGVGLTANIGTHVDGRLTLAWPLIGHSEESGGPRVYFGIGAQF